MATKSAIVAQRSFVPGGNFTIPFVSNAISSLDQPASIKISFDSSFSFSNYRFVRSSCVSSISEIKPSNSIFSEQFYRKSVIFVIGSMVENRFMIDSTQNLSYVVPGNLV